VYSTLNGLRGFAAVAVLTIHGQGFFGPWIAKSGYLAVDLFFVMSGFVIAHAYEGRFKSGLGTAEFFWIRFVRFYPLFLVGTVIGSISAVLAWKMGAGELGRSELIQAVFLGLFMLPSPDLNMSFALYPTNPPGWSLFYELIINTFYVAFWRVLSNRVLLVTTAVAAAMIVVSAVYFGTLDIGSYWGTVSGGIIRVYFSFFAGVLIYRRGLPKLPPGVLSWIPLLLATGLVAVDVDGTARIVFDVFCVLVMFPAIIAVSTSIEPDRFSRSLFEYLGAASYALYAIHAPILELARRAVRMFGFAPATFAPWLGVALLLAIFAFALALNRLYDEPARRILSRLTRRVTAARS